MPLARSALLWITLAIPTIEPGAAQEHRGTSGPKSAPTYAGMEQRSVKALSDQQIADLKAGHGMGLALAAELNGYPGPSHVLELADALQLSDEQRSRTKELFEAMKAEAISLGERVVVEETALDRLFAEKRIMPEMVEAATSRIGMAQGQLRAAHLRSHLAMMEVLSPSQIILYGELRGYPGSGRHDHRHDHKAP
jgi:hypothetical protein